MRQTRTEHGTVLFLSGEDTWNWADGYTPDGFQKKHDGAWPCSQLRGKRVKAEFDRKGNLVDLTVNGRSAPDDLSCDELNAIVEDAIGTAHPEVAQSEEGVR